MKAFMIRCGKDRLIGHADTDCNEPGTIGAYRPGLDGNYYDHLVIGFTQVTESYCPSFSEWWANMIGVWYAPHDEFYDFDAADCVIIEVEIPMGE